MLHASAIRSSVRVFVVAISIALAGCTATITGGAKTTMDQPFNRETATQAAVDLSNASTPALRNLIIQQRETMIGTAFERYKAQLEQERKRGKFFSEITDMFLSVGGVVTKSTVVKTNLATASTLLNGSNSIIDHTLLYDKTITALITAMEAKRAEVRLRIARSMGKDLDAYPFSEVAQDLHDLENAGTLADAITYIQSSAEQDKKDTEAIINSEYREIYALSADERLIKACATRSLDPANPTRTRDAMLKAMATMSMATTTIQKEDELANLLQDKVRQIKSNNDVLAIDTAFRDAHLYDQCGK